MTHETVCSVNLSLREYFQNATKLQEDGRDKGTLRHTDH